MPDRTSNQNSKLRTAIGRNAMLVLKTAVSGFFIILLLHKVDFHITLLQARRLDGLAVAAVLVVVLVQTCILAGLRLQFALSAVGSRLPFWSATQIALSGLFVEQVAFGFAGGDAARLWLLRRAQVPLASSLPGLLLDRAIGLGSLLALSLVGLETIIMVLGRLDLRISIIAASAALAMLAVGLASLFAYRHRLSEGLAAFIREFRMKGSTRKLWYCVAVVFALALLIHLLNVLVIWLLARPLGLPLSLAQCLFVVPTVLLVSMLPIASGGWGIREGMMVLVLGQLGIAAEQAIVPSLVFGTATLLAALPGSIAWTIGRGSAANVANGFVEQDSSARACRTTSRSDEYERVGRVV